MIHGHPVIDADGHKCENPIVFLDHVDAAFRHRISFVRDRYGEQRIRILDRHPGTGRAELPRLFLQPEGYGKGTFRPYHETTLGGLFNRIRIEHLDREGIDHQVVYGSVALGFNSVIDPELGVALCRAFNDYLHEDCAPWSDRLHPVGVLPLQMPDEAVRELRRCVLELGMPAVCVPPNVPVPHPTAPEQFPALRVPKHLSHPDYEPVLAEAERLGIALALHGAPGFQLAGGTSDQLESFTLVHVFANRSMQQMALARLAFDGAMEAHPGLRFGFLEAGCGWLPDLLHSLGEHWERRVRHFDPSLEPSVPVFLRELARERRGRVDLVRRARGLLSMLFAPSERPATRADLERFRHEHPRLPRDPREYAARGQIFATAEPDDPSPGWLPAALGDVGRELCGFATDYGHWDATVRRSVSLASEGLEPALAVQLLSSNALAFYGDRLRARIDRAQRPAAA